jgi:hypothetical protein
MPLVFSFDTILLIVGKEEEYNVQNSSLTVANEILPLTAEKAMSCISRSVSINPFRALMME